MLTDVLDHAAARAPRLFDNWRCSQRRTDGRGLDHQVTRGCDLTWPSPPALPCSSVLIRRADP